MPLETWPGIQEKQIIFTLVIETAPLSGVFKPGYRL